MQDKPSFPNKIYLLKKLKQKKFFNYLLLGLLGAFTALLLIESILRIYQFLGDKQLLGVKPTRTTLTWIDNPGLGKVILQPNSSGWMVTPSKEYYNYINVNNEGFYDSNHSLEKPSDTFRILFLGDSFVASLQTPLSQTFFKQLETALSKKSLNKRVEILAMGMGDTGTAQQYIALKKIGLKYKPDLVVSMLLTANDLKNDSPFLQKDSYRPYFILNKENQLTLLPHAQYSQRIGSTIKNWFKDLRIIELILQVRQTYQEYKTNHLADYPIEYHVYDVNYTKEYSDSLKVTERLILEEKKIVEENGGKYILITLANNEQVNKSVWDGLKKEYPNLAKVNIDLQKPDKILKQFCDDQKVDCLQLLPFFLDFAKNNPTTPTHYRLDGHWNQIGTDIVAQFLINNLILTNN